MLAPLFLLFAQTEHQHHPPRDASEYAKILEDPKRDAWQKPHDVIMALKLRSDESIADIGSGSGYFTRRFANHAKLVYAVDIDQKLLDIVARAKLANVKTVLAGAADPRLPDGGVDTVFICDVLHHIGDRPAYYARLRKALKPGGRIVVIDFFKKELPVGPPVSMKLDQSQVIAELKAAGFAANRALGELPYQYFLEFR